MGKKRTKKTNKKFVEKSSFNSHRNISQGKQNHKKKLSKFNLLNIAYPILLFFIFVQTYQYIFDKKINLGGDNAAYYILGKAISSGEGYTNIHTINKTPANHFPPGYPAIIGAIMKIFSDKITTIKATNGILFLLTVLILYFLFKSLSLNIHLSFVVSLFVLINTSLLSYATIMMSEISYLFFATLSIFLFIKTDLSKNPLTNHYFYLFLICSIFTYHIRTAGIALFGGIILYLLYKKNWKYLLSYFTGYVLLALPWFIRGQNLGGNSYLNQLIQVNVWRPELGQIGISDLFTRILKNIVRYITKEIPSGCLNFITVDYKKEAVFTDWLIGILLLIIMIYGLYKLRKHRLLIIFYLTGTFGILLLSPENWFGRYTLPVIPFLLFFLILGIYELLCYGLNKINIKRKLHPLFFLLLIFLFIPKIKFLHKQAKGVFMPKYKNYFEIAQWVNKNTDEDVIICCRKPHLFYLYADRRVTKYKYTLNTDELLEDLKSKQVDYVVLEQLGYSSTGRYLYPAVKEHSKKFPVVQHLKNPDTYLLKFQ